MKTVSQSQQHSSPSPPNIILEPCLTNDDKKDDPNSITLLDENNGSKIPVRKLSNASIRRRLSGCFRKQDSHECPILKVDDEPVSMNDPKLNQRKQPTEQNKTTPWYRRASKIIHQRRVSVDALSTQPQSSSSSSSFKSNENVDEPNIIVAQGVCQYYVPAKRGSDSMLGVNQETQPRNRNLEISSLLANASKRFLTASFNDLIVPLTPRSPPPSLFPAPNNHNQPPFIHSESNLVIVGHNDRQPVQRSMSGGAGANKTGPNVIGSAGALVGRILQEDLGKYIDPGVIHAAQQELAEACNLTQEGLVNCL